MQTNFTPDILAEHIAKLSKYSTSWDNKEVQLSSLDRLIKENLRLILSQTENPETAPNLQKSLYALSHRMEKEQKFNTPEGNNLAFEVTSIAFGIFSNAKPEWNHLPNDALQLIFSKNLPENPRNLKSGLEASKSVSKAWNSIAEKVEKQWVEQERISLRIFGCRNAREAVKCTTSKGLLSANLKDFPDITDHDLTRLIAESPNINHLIVRSDKITAFPLEKLSQLKTLSLPGCHRITEIKLTRALKNFLQLSILNLSGCGRISEHGLAEALKGLPQLTSLKLNKCDQYAGMKLAKSLKALSHLMALSLFHLKEGNILVESLKNLSKLTQLSLIKCKNIPGDELAEVVKGLPKLIKLRLTESINNSGDKLLEVMKSHPQLIFLDLSRFGQVSGDILVEGIKNLSQLTSLNLTWCSLITENHLEEILKCLSKLRILNLTSCVQIKKTSLVEWQKEYPKINFMNT